MTSTDKVKYYASLNLKIAEGDCEVLGVHLSLDGALRIQEKTGCVVSEIAVREGASMRDVVEVAIRNGRELIAKLTGNRVFRERLRIWRELCVLPKYQLN